jgi:hypothetical protein
MAALSRLPLIPRAFFPLSAAFLLGACTASKPPLVPDAASPASNEAPARFPQTPEILALEKAVTQDSSVQAILKRHPGTRLKLRQIDSHMSACLVEQRQGKWFNISNQLSAAEQSEISAALARAGEASGWKSVEVQAR